MLRNQYDFFETAYRKYEKILLDYKKDNSKVFVDGNFHPTFKIPEPELVSKENPQIPEPDLYGGSIKWRRIDEVYKAPLFKKDIIHPLYVNQGSLGDCYFITALSRIAKQNGVVQALFEKQLPDKILGEVPDSLNIKCGAVVVYFRVFGRRTPVLIDTLIPFKDTNFDQPVFSRPPNKEKSAWFCLVEKAYAKLNGSYSNIVGGRFPDSMCSFFGYYKKIFCLTCDMKTAILKVLKYQKLGCLMDSSISTEDEDRINKAREKKLVEGHSYLLLKARKYEKPSGEDMIFFQLLNLCLDWRLFD